MTLSLAHNKLTALPKEFYKLIELRWLSLSHNEISKIEADFGDFVMLNFLVRDSLPSLFFKRYLQDNITQNYYGFLKYNV